MLALELVERVVDDYFAADRARIRVRGPADLRVQVDEARLTLIVKNLVGNALRYTPADHATVEVDISSRDGGRWQLAVSDQGPGVPPDQVQHLGEPFYRGDPSRTRGTGGSGLGLYLARLAAQAHGGTLEFDRGQARGARFVVTLRCRCYVSVD